MHIPNKKQEQKKWYHYIAPQFQKDFLLVLEQLSRLNDKENPSFIIVGALALLINNVVHYTVIFDIDLLFKDKDSLFRFVEVSKKSKMKIQFLDDHLMVGKSISSLHTMWTHSGKWINVDLILRKNLYDLHCSTLPLSEIFYSDTIKHNNSRYDLNLFVANPWNIFIDKILSPRLETEIDKLDSFGVDIKHIFTMLCYFKDDTKFWNHINNTLTKISKLERAKENLNALNEIAESIGYAKFDFENKI